ncbi:glycosyltransferase family 4 protein [Maribacter algarum]|uniref:Glycosyltransferase family 4 protein n=1 Tax=Maribacter algarum (ex Zhang et al. 2020) TaxID=2578118 RepID=A0A5S3QK60_9FLAO|nr:glycosyltransferase family 4 protein [Maribacter algarum]TMM58204.1 glycosyltransferase family 4 protein [Maribacter algarum]
MVNTKRVLLIAYACEPDKTSEPGVGWNMGNHISKAYDTIILTRANNRAVIESKQAGNVEFIYYDLPSFFTSLKKRLPLGTQIYYALWQWGAYFYVNKFMKSYSRPIDLVHHLNFAISWIAPPGYLLKQPFVWGPIGGGDTVPMRFLKNMGFGAVLQELIYTTVNQINRISIFSFFTRKKADAILFRTQSSARTFPKRKSTIYETISETAMPAFSFKNHPKKNHSKNIKAICVGRMNYWKGFLYAVKGFHRFLEAGGSGTLELFGDGKEMSSIEKYINKNKLENSIFVRGFVDNAKIKMKMVESDVLIHPSFREGGSWSIMEAMSYGLPIICLDTSGPKDMVTENCGLLIDLKSSKMICEQIGDGLMELSHNEKKYLDLSTNAQKRIMTEYTWVRRKEQICHIYEDVLNKTKA